MEGLQRGDSCGGRRGESRGGGWGPSHTARHTAAELGCNTEHSSTAAKTRSGLYRVFLVVDLQNFDFGIRKSPNVILVM